MAAVNGILPRRTSVMGKPPKEPVVAESPEAKRFLLGMRALVKVPKEEVLDRVGVRRGNIGTTGQ